MLIDVCCRSFYALVYSPSSIAKSDRWNNHITREYPDCCCRPGFKREVGASTLGNNSPRYGSLTRILRNSVYELFYLARCTANCLRSTSPCCAKQLSLFTSVL